MRLEFTDGHAGDAPLFMDDFYGCSAVGDVVISPDGEVWKVKRRVVDYREEKITAVVEPYIGD